MNLPPVSQRALTTARRNARKLMLRHFRALLVNHDERLVAAGQNGLPLIVYTNYPGRWNGMFMVVLSEVLPARVHRAPMNAEALSYYPMLRRAGMFPVDGTSVQAGVQFVRTALRLLAQGEVLWLSPEGRSVDPRRRPLVFKPGLAAVASRVQGGCLALPCAVEYTLWDGRLPEALAYFGEPFAVNDLSAEQADAMLRQALERAMDELKHLSMERNADAFRVVASGATGTDRLGALARKAMEKLRGIG